jgi:hypothetical protein
MGEKIFFKHQAGLESTRGTQVAATRKVYCTALIEEDVNTIFPVNEDRGSLTTNFRSQPGLIKAALNPEGVVTFEDLAWWCQLALKAPVTGSVRNTTVYDYLFVPTQAADDLKSATWEAGDDTQAWKAGFVMVDELEISGALGEQLRFRARLVADDWATATFTGAIGDRVTEDALVHLAKLSVGAAGAVPSSYMSGRFIGFSFKIANQLAPKWFADGAGAKYTGMGRDTRKFTLGLTFEGNAATITERANYDNKTARVARLTVSGSNIAGSSPTTAKTIDLVMPGVWTKFDMKTRETNVIFDAMLEAQYDAALAYDLSLTVSNALSALA